MSDEAYTRAKEEWHELNERVNKLVVLLSKPQPDFISDYHWELLGFQYHAMATYRAILGKRVKDWEQNRTSKTSDASSQVILDNSERAAAAAALGETDE